MVLLLLVLLLLVFVVAALCVIYKPPFFLIRYFQHRWTDILWHVPTTDKVVALTIDDSPSAYTREILSILQANDATATFFVIGSQIAQSESHKATVSDLARAKNELGNHAMHDEPSCGLSDEVLGAQIREVEEMIREAYATAASPTANSFSSPSFNKSAATDDRPSTTITKPDHPETTTGEPVHFYFRPGSGFFSFRMRKVVKELGYRLVLGSVYPHDPQIPFWRMNAWHIFTSVRPGSIIICHDRSWTIPMLRMVLPELKRRGYRVVTVTQLVKEASR